MDALQHRPAEAKSSFLEGGGHVGVILVADREIESLERWLRESQGREAMREADLNVEMNMMKAEIDDLCKEESRTSLELQVKHSEMGE